MALIDASTIDLSQYEVEAIENRNAASRDVAEFLASDSECSLLAVKGNDPQKASAYIAALKKARSDKDADARFGISRVGNKTDSKTKVTRKDTGKTHIVVRSKWTRVDYLMLNKVNTADDDDDK